MKKYRGAKRKREIINWLMGLDPEGYLTIAKGEIVYIPNEKPEDKIIPIKAA